MANVTRERNDTDAMLKLDEPENKRTVMLITKRLDNGDAELEFSVITENQDEQAHVVVIPAVTAREYAIDVYNIFKSR